MSKEHEITVNHYTLHPNWHDTIKEIYSLINVNVNFVDERDEENPRVYSHFAEDDGIIPTAFPKVDLPTVPMPSRYIVLNERSGKSYEHGRTIPQDQVNKICDTHKQPVVLLGAHTSIEHDQVVDMTDQTTLLEAFSIIKGAGEFYGFQGILSFFALSQKIPSTIYCRDDNDLRSVEIRTLPEWRLYIKEIKIVSSELL